MAVLLLEIDHLPRLAVDLLRAAVAREVDDGRAGVAGQLLGEDGAVADVGEDEPPAVVTEHGPEGEQQTLLLDLPETIDDPGIGRVGRQRRPEIP